MASSPSPGPSGALLGGRYAVRRKLGSGGTGSVYLVDDSATGRCVALKLIGAESITTRAILRLQEEFTSLRALRHPQIAAAYDFGYAAEGKLPFYTREYIAGQPLQAGPPPSGSRPTEYLAPILDLLDALHYLHAHALLHLDVHAGNLIIADDPKRGGVLIDFGVLRSPEGGTLGASRTSWSSLPPELLSGGARPATDLYMAGRLLLHRLTGLREGEARLPKEICGWGVRATLELERIVAKALEKDPDRRFRTALEFRDALASALGSGRAAPSIEPREVLCGRERELATIDEALRDLASGGSALLWITGETGLGKTRLLSEARMRGQIQALEVIESSFYPDPGPDSSLVRAVRGGRKARRFSTRGAEPSEPEGGTPQERARKSVASLLARKGPPLLVLLDDADRADGEARHLASALVEAAAAASGGPKRRALAVLATASGRAARRPAGAKTLHLRPLPSAAARRLLEDLLGPARAPRRLIREAVRRAGGFPAVIRRIGCALREDPGRMTRSTLETALLPHREAGSIEGAPQVLASLSAGDRDVLLAIVVLGGSARGAEIAAALEEPALSVGRRLQRLGRLELVLPAGSSRERSFHAAPLGPGKDERGLLPPARAREMRLRAARFLSLHGSGARDMEKRARLLLLAGSKDEAFEAAMAAARELRRRGFFDRAASVLEEALCRETEPDRRHALADAASACCEESGDNARGIRVLEPFFGRKALEPSRSARLRRKLGVHYHRAGRIEDARRTFRRLERDADPLRDLEDLVLVDSEIAELDTLRGDYSGAEAACRRGLARLGRLDPGSPLVAKMEVMLRASLGHLHLRCMRLEPAREELRRAIDLAGRQGSAVARASILNNLALTENYLNHIAEARRCFRKAERLLQASGEDHALVEIACNLALLAAKTGDREEALAQTRKASRLAAGSTGGRIGFFSAYTRGVVAWLLGEAGDAVEEFERALPLGRELGDLHLVGYGEVYLADAHLACGRPGEALRHLRRLGDRSRPADEPPLIRRMVRARLSFLETLLGRKRRAERVLEELRRIPKTGVALVEAWNDVFLGFRALLAGESATLPLTASLDVFRRLGTPAGERFARAGLVMEALLLENRPGLRRRLREMESARPGGFHRILDVIEPLLDAEASWFLGDTARARDSISRASAAMVGAPFLELDWRIELLRARVARWERDMPAARRHLHRCIHTRDLLVRLLPRGMRDRYLASSRFQGLDELSAKLEGSPRLHASTPRLSFPGRLEGLIGHGPEMALVFRQIESLRDQDIAVLIAGETGTGKELAARAIHGTSSRKGSRFLALHCAALPPELFEAELFGYEAGSFTGAEETHAGILESLSGGTLLLDEVGELPLGVQAKLLHVLESGSARRLGGLEPVRIDVRFLASTGCDLDAMAAGGAFRPDLYYRLRGFEIRLPPLRSRKADVEPLARHFIEAQAASLDRAPPVLTREALALLEGHSWPGNVRELETVLLRALLALGSSETLGAAEIRPLLAQRKDETLYTPEVLEGRGLEDLKKELERAYLSHLFRKLGGDPEAMMKALGVKRSRLYAWMRKLKLDPRQLRTELEG